MDKKRNNIIYVIFLEKSMLFRYNTNRVIKRDCRSGGTGRRAGLKIPWWQHRIGSIPICGTS